MKLERVYSNRKLDKVQDHQVAMRPRNSSRYAAGCFPGAAGSSRTGVEPLQPISQAGYRPDHHRSRGSQMSCCCNDVLQRCCNHLLLCGTSFGNHCCRRIRRVAGSKQPRNDNGEFFEAHQHHKRPIAGQCRDLLPLQAVSPPVRKSLPSRCARPPD